MTRISKLYASVVSNPGASLTFRDFESLIRAFGFEAARQRGSHRSYKHIKVQRMLVIQPRGNEAKAYQVRQFLDMIQEYGLAIDDE